ncbi:MAG TPA: serine--tRNA ligase [Anaerolineae bacterium]|nr:serine--tRNA ligase [Anaerolineae bacterium]HQK13653.1 serine--tRNA ligase [Anaerolineae bacterium]
MLDIELIRNDIERVREALRKRNDDPTLVDKVYALDVQRRQMLQEVETLRAERNRVSKEIGQMKDKDARQARIAEMRALGERLAALEEKLREVEAAFEAQQMWLPNIPHESVPVGPDESANVVVRYWGERRDFAAEGFTPLPHWDLGPALDILDFERGVKLAGSRFYILKGAGARLQRATLFWMLDVQTRQNGYTEVYLPFVVKREMLVGAGQLPKFEDNLYHDVEDDLWLLPTAEVAITNLHRDEILSAEQLPLNYVAYTPCFRREKMSAGRDVRGIKRGHQFDKVEMYKFTTPETSFDELEAMVKNAEGLLQMLKIPYRVVELCTGDISFGAAKGFDLEVWAPGQDAWLEVSSCSNVTDFQARRANVRYRPEPDARPRFVHTLNGSGLAMPRLMIAIMENYQQADGSIVIPEVLRPWMGGIDVIRR